MKKTVLKYGAISGAVVGVLAAILTPLCLNGGVDPSNMQVLGYTVMLLAFIAVFLGIRSYREQQNGGTITFGKAFKVGILITLVASAVYVIGWEIVYWGFMPDFGDKYAAYAIRKLEAEGATPATIAEARKKMAEFVELYKNPFFNVGMTFLEIFPVGLIVSLISAAILRKKAPAAFATA
jgi:Protein of unknown function (DUF4199)